MNHGKDLNALFGDLVDHAIRPFDDLTDRWRPVLGDGMAGQRERADLPSTSGDAIHHS